MEDRRCQHGLLDVLELDLSRDLLRSPGQHVGCLLVLTSPRCQASEQQQFSDACAVPRPFGKAVVFIPQSTNSLHGSPALAYSSPLTNAYQTSSLRRHDHLSRHRRSSPSMVVTPHPIVTSPTVASGTMSSAVHAAPLHGQCIPDSAHIAQASSTPIWRTGSAGHCRRTALTLPRATGGSSRARTSASSHSVALHAYNPSRAKRCS